MTSGSHCWPRSREKLKSLIVTTEFLMELKYTKKTIR
jgi:hypothetical protein